VDGKREGETEPVRRQDGVRRREDDEEEEATARG